jgi:pimeloyl-ACP methyl ester carboxylesterase
MKRPAHVLAALLTALALAAPLQAADIGQFGYFFVGGHYTADKSAMTGQSHVFYLLPGHRTRKLPVIFVPGMGQTITNFLKTPDGRPGWAKQFLDQGYAVYLMDQPGRGNSGYNRQVYGPPARQSPLLIEQRFTAPQNFAPHDGEPIGWPQARLHTQWPGSGMMGSPPFDQFYASQVESMSGELSAQLVPLAAAALLDKIGPAIVLTHSQSGAYGWAIDEARPKLVRAIVAIEPGGPPFFSAPAPWGDGAADKLVRRWGITSTPLLYAPALKPGEELARMQETKPDGPGLVACWRQKTPARRLVNLSEIPVLIVTSQASYHSGYDHCTAAYLEQAGVETDFVRLPDIGILGNGHMMMLEKNNGAISAVIGHWLASRHLAP